MTTRATACSPCVARGGQGGQGGQGVFAHVCAGVAFYIYLYIL